MKLWPFGRKALAGTPDVLETFRSRQNNMLRRLGGGSDATRRIQAVYEKAQSAGYVWMYANSPAVRTVVDLIARNIGQLDWRLYEELDQARREARPEHPAAMSVRFPSESMTTDQFVRALVTDFLIFNNAYALKFRTKPGGPVVLKPIPAHRVGVLGDRMFDASAYKVYRDDGTFAVIEDPRDVIHWRGWNPDDPRVGFSPLETLRGVIAEDAALQQSNVELAQSGMMPGVVERPLEAPPWSNDAARAFAEDLAARVKRKHAVPVVLEEGMKWNTVGGVSPREAQMIEVRRWVLQQVASLFGVPLGMVGLEKYTAEAQSAFYADTLPPYCEALSRQLNLSLLQVEFDEPDFCFEFNLDEKMMGDDRQKALVSATGRPVKTTNEARAQLNLPPIDGGDELVTPANVIVGDNPKPSTDIMPIQDPNKPEQDGSYREEKALDVTTRPRLEADVTRQRRNEEKATATFVRHFSRLGRTLRRQKAPDFDRDRWTAELTRDLERVIEQMFESEGGIYAARLGAADFDMGEVKHYIRAKAESVSEAVNDATADHLRELDLDQVLGGLAERADVLGVSVGATTTTKARVEAARQAPFPERRLKTWRSNSERHANLNGATVPLDSTWGGITPGSEPNCRCSCTIT